MALGFGLFYLLAASKNEVTKMIELRKELEMLLQNAKEKLQSQNRAILSKPSESNVISNCSTFDVQESLISNGSVSLQSQFFFKNQVDSETPEQCNHSLTCKTSRQENCIQGIDQLEAELEAELERMQIHMDTGDNLEYTKQHKVEVYGIMCTFLLRIGSVVTVLGGFSVFIFYHCENASFLNEGFTLLSAASKQFFSIEKCTTTVSWLRVQTLVNSLSTLCTE